MGHSKHHTNWKIKAMFCFLDHPEDTVQAGTKTLIYFNLLLYSCNI